LDFAFDKISFKRTEEGKAVAVGVGVNVGVKVTVGEGVMVDVLLGVNVGRGVRVSVGVGDNVSVGCALVCVILGLVGVQGITGGRQAAYTTEGVEVRLLAKNRIANMERAISERMAKALFFFIVDSLCENYDKISLILNFTPTWKFCVLNSLLLNLDGVHKGSDDLQREFHEWANTANVLKIGR
jgi:hypothetical protein